MNFDYPPMPPRPGTENDPASVTNWEWYSVRKAEVEAKEKVKMLVRSMGTATLLGAVAGAIVTFAVQAFM